MKMYSLKFYSCAVLLLGINVSFAEQQNELNNAAAQNCNAELKDSLACVLNEHGIFNKPEAKTGFVMQNI